MSKQVSATDLSRNLSDYINRVELNGEEFTVVRNEREVARLSPAPVGRSAEEVMRPLYGVLSEAAGKTWVADAKKRRSRRKELRDPWAS